MKMKFFFENYGWNEWTTYVAMLATCVFWGAYFLNFRITWSTIPSILLGACLGQLVIWYLERGRNQ